MKKLSIIVPVYQVEKYIRQCVESVFIQDMDDNEFELILIDDGTRDNSFAKIADITAHHSNVFIVKQANQGLSVARNTGTAKASGQYILFLDSDDLLMPLSLKPLVEKVVESDADLMVAGFVKASDEEIEGITEVKVMKDLMEVKEKTGSELFIEDLNPRECYVWRTIYKRSFLESNGLRFIPGLYFEDVPFTVECWPKAGRCLITDSVFYIYRQHPQSICSSIDSRKINDLNTVVARLWDMRKKMNLSLPIDEKFMDVVFTTFSIAQWYIVEYDNLFAVKKQLVDDLKKKAPKLWFNGSMKQRIVSFFFRFMPCQYLWFRRLTSK